MKHMDFQNMNNNDAPIVWTGVNTPGELERLSGMWVTKAGARFFPSGFKYDSRSNVHWEWGAVLDGEFSFNYNNKSVTISRGMSYIMAPDISLFAKSTNTPFLVWIELSGPVASEALKNLGGIHGDIKMDKFHPEQVNCVLRIARLLHEHPQGYELHVNSILWRFLASSLAPSIKHTSKFSREIQNTIDFLNTENNLENYSLPELARISQLPLETFRKRFTSEVGESPIKYVLKYRLMQAKELLSDKALTIQQISLQAGFKDQFYFSRIFKKYEGLSPSEFRKRFFPELYFTD